MFPTGVQPHQKTSMLVVLEKTLEAVLLMALASSSTAWGPNN